MHITFRPLLYNVMVFTEHTFAGARRIYKHHIEIAVQVSEFIRAVFSNHYIGSTPFYEVFIEDDIPFAYQLIAYQKAAWRKHTKQKGAFAAGGGAHIQDFKIFREINKIGEYHGRCFLRIICPGM